MIDKNVLKHGAMLFVGLLTYFLLMRLLGLTDRYDFRIFNGVIQIAIVYLAIRSYAKKKPAEFGYLSGTMTGILTSLVGVAPFAFFQMVYLYLDAPFLETIRESAPVVGPYVNPFSGGIIVFVEGMAVGLILSYICMRIVDWKTMSHAGETGAHLHEA